MEKSNMKKVKVNFLLAGIWLIAFIVLTVLVIAVDVQPIGPMESEIGLASVNGAMLRSYNPIWDIVSDVSSILALLTAAGFGCLGLWQWISRKSLKKVDIDLLILAGSYIVLALIYVFFEIVIINYRPILMDGMLEASYPSSHTVLVCGIMLTTGAQLKSRVKCRPLCIIGVVLCALIMIVTALGCVFAGVHWYTDVLAGVLLSGALAYCYNGVTGLLKCKLKK